MTDEQFNKFLNVQIAQLALLDGIYKNVQALAADKGKAGGHNWKDVNQMLESAAKTNVPGR